MIRRILIYGMPGPLGHWLEGRIEGIDLREIPTVDRRRQANLLDDDSMVLIDSRAESAPGEIVAEVRAASSHAAILYLTQPKLDPVVRDRIVERFAVDAHLPLPVDLPQIESCVRSLLGRSEARVAAAGEISGTMSRLWEKYRPTNLRRVEKLEEAVAALLTGELDHELRSEAAREAHKLAGTGGTFGFPEASAMAREMETWLEQGGAVASAGIARMSEIVEGLRSLIESESRSRIEPDHQEVLLIITQDRKIGSALSSSAARRSISPLISATCDEGWQLLERSKVLAVVLDLEMDGEAENTLVFLARMNGRFPQIPIIVLSAKASTFDRVEVSRFGGRGFFPRQSPAPEVIDGVLQLVRMRDHRPRILAVDDDPQILEALRTTLDTMNVTVMTEPGDFMETVREVNPEMVILDIDMPRIDGLHLCRAMRMNARTAHIPVMILTARSSADVIRQVFAVGADDYVGKPFIAEELIARVSGRVMRSRLSRQMSELDGLTGVLNRGAFAEKLEDMAVVARQTERAIAFVLFRLAGLSEINLRLGHAAGDGCLVRLVNRLRESIGYSELIGRWGGTEIVMALSGLGRAEGAERIEPLLRNLNDAVRIEGQREDLQPWVTASVSQYPADGADPLTLFQCADLARRSADAIGFRAVVTSGWSASDGGTEAVDIVIVDDDETVSSLLVETLTAWHYRVAAIRDGLEAVEKLTGAAPSLRARVVLLDVDMPKMDGHSVLRRMKESGILRNTRVIMLTVRGSESEVLTTMRLGAFDHVTKPFSIPVLLERLRRALT